MLRADLTNTPSRDSPPCQPQIRVIWPQPKTILRPGGKHPIRLTHTHSNQIVNKYANHSLCPIKNERLFSGNRPGGVQTSNQALRRSLFVTGSAIDLACEIEPLDFLGF